MRVYLDESKRLQDGKIVFAWFVTKHSQKYIDGFISEKKLEYHIFSKNIEIKWTQDIWKKFYNDMIHKNNFSIIENSIIWINVSWYYRDYLGHYKLILLELFNRNINFLKNYSKTIIIHADKIKLWRNTRKIEKEIEKYLNDNLNISWKIKFNFVESKNHLWIQIADLIAYKLWKTYFYNESLDDFILNNAFNTDLYKEFEL